MFVTVFKTQRETIEILVPPAFTKEGFRNSQLEQYGELAVKALSKEAREFAKQQYNLINPLNN
jgi:hypothetical protein